MAKAAAGAAAFVPIFVIIVIGAVLFLPLSPFLSVTFTIQTVQRNYQTTVDIQFTSASHTRVTLTQSYSATDGSLTLSNRPAEKGQYSMEILVSYGDVTILHKMFDQIGDGTYTLQVLYTFRQETSGVPYVVTISVSGPTIQPAMNSQAIYP
jgi:predicted phage tail protein